MAVDGKNTPTVRYEAQIPTKMATMDDEVPLPHHSGFVKVGDLGQAPGKPRDDE